MAIEVTIPELGESITEGTIVAWLVEVGEVVEEDQPLLELETDKITAELPAPSAGVIIEQLFEAGADVDVGAVVARIDPDGAARPKAARPKAAPAAAPPAAEAPPQSPAVRRLITEHALDAAQIAGTGKDGRLLKGDVLAWIEAATQPDLGPDAAAQAEELDLSSTIAGMPTLADELRSTRNVKPIVAPSPPSTRRPSAPSKPAAPQARSTISVGGSGAGGRVQRRVRMTRMRRAIATRLKEVQNTAAILTTFNEVDMKPVMDLRTRYKEAFLKRHGTKLGFMSFFIKASIEALKEYPALNGWIDGNELVYNEYYDLGVAVSSERGLVVPVIRDADRLSFAEIEQTIRDLAGAARDGTLTLEQMSGGTFSITNGGTFGSMLSTPILNPPQSGILGMHNIVRRPWVVGDSIEIRPIMYVALSYDHRIVDGSQAVRFLVKIRQLLEDPARLLLEV
jgi:2-oxoglutarate dehydrogenase E2 component (dihydrolipoamide succinyltransferase)